jgi:hypothetical protein
MDLPDTRREREGESDTVMAGPGPPGAARLSVPALLIPIGTVVLIFGAVWYISTAHHLAAAKRDYERVMQACRTTYRIDANRTNPYDPYRPYTRDASTHVTVRQGPDPAPECRSRTAALNQWLASSRLVMFGGGALVGVGIVGAFLWSSS